jgi:hypothetical protein
VIATRHARLVVPATALVLGSAIAVGAWVGSGWGAAVGIEAVTLAGALLYYFLGSRDSDLGALMGSRPDERQASIGMRSTALTGFVLILMAIGGVVVTSALAEPAWPFLLFCVVGGATYLAGLVIYRNR